MLSQDFSDRLSEFNAQNVEYLVVGAHALATHGHIRATNALLLSSMIAVNEDCLTNHAKYGILILRVVAVRL